MKLKKIASLALAGIMAVSMLTACDTTSVDPEPTPNPDPTPSTGYSSMLEDKMSVQVTNKTVFQDDANLNAALDYAVGNIGNDVITNEFLNNVWGLGNIGGGVRFITYNKAWEADPLRMVVSTMRDKLDVKADWNGEDDKGTLDNIRPVETANHYANYKKNNVNTLLVYVVDDGVAITNALDQIKNSIQSTWEDELFDDFQVTGQQNSGRDYHYDCSVAVSNRNFESGHGVGVNFIAVEVTRVDGNK